MTDHSPVTPGASEPVLVGRYLVPGHDNELLPVSQRELVATAHFIQDVLESFAFPMGTPILVASTMDQAAHFYPLEQAAMVMNLVVCNAEPTFFDANRVESIIRRLDPRAIIGVSVPMLEGLMASGHAPDILFAGRVIFADPAAHAQLAGKAGFILRLWMEVGPALAIECNHGRGAHIDDREWLLEVVEGRAHLTSRLPRACDFHGWPGPGMSGLDAAACPCGLAHRRVKP